MTKRLAIHCIVLFAAFGVKSSAQEKQALRLVQTIRCLESKAASITWAWIWNRNGCLWPRLQTIRWKWWTDCRKVIKSLVGFKDTRTLCSWRRLQQTLRIQPRWPCEGFPRESFWLVQDFKVEPDPNRLFYDPPPPHLFWLRRRERRIQCVRTRGYSGAKAWSGI